MHEQRENRTYKKRNQPKEVKLNAILNMFSAVNINHIDKLTNTFSFILSEQLRISRFALFVQQNNEWLLFAKHGIKRRLCRVNVARELTKITEITIIADSTSETLSKFDRIIPITIQKQILAYLLIQENNKHDQGEYLIFLQTLGNLLVSAIENQRVAHQQVQQERIAHELKVAHEMQKLLFPTRLPSNKWIDIAAKYIPKYEVGGDYYDFIPIGNRDFLMCIGDVSGKGIGAAMLMAHFQASFRALFLYQNYDLRFIVAHLNKKIIESAKGEKFITCFLAHFNAQTRELKYINAGHNHPILTDGKELQMLKKGCIGLGIFDELPQVEVGQTTLKPNTCIISYTDGVVELENKEEVQFGLDRLIQIIHNSHDLGMQTLNEKVFSALYKWKGEQPLVDDTALFACKIF